MSNIRVRWLKSSVFLIVCLAWLSQCYAFEFSEEEFIEKLNGVVKNGILNEIVKSIPEDDGNSAFCVQDLLQWSEDFNSSKVWALTMLDAGGRPPHGILKGNINSLGMFDECLGISHQRNDYRTIKGKYCMARIPLPSILTGRNEKILASHNARMLRNPEVNQRTPNLGPGNIYIFNLAVCLPASCKASFVETLLTASLVASNIPLTIGLPGEYCSVDEPRPWDAGEIVSAIVLSLVGVLLIIGTLYDVWYQKVKKGDLKSQNLTLTAFSMFTNSKRLTTLSKDPGPLACIHGIRVLSICWIIVGHRYTDNGTFPVENVLEVFAWMKTYGAMTLVASTVTVDTFLLLSGILLSYVFFRRTDNKSLRDIPMMYLHRFLRLTPVLIMTMLIQFTLVAKIGRGPFWAQMNYGIKDCVDYWWSTLLYVQNYVNPTNLCLAHTWYLSVDMQLYILSPLLLFPILKNAKIGIAWAGVWLLAALVTLFTICYTKGWGASSFSNDDPIGPYYPTHMRAAPWIIGLVAGYYLRMYNLKKIYMNKIVVVILWIASLAVMSAVLYGLKPLSDDNHVFSYLEDTTYLTFSRTAWAVAVLWVIVACAFGYGGPVNWFLSLRLWEFLARLSYSMYLIHITLMNYFVSTSKTVPHFSHDQWAHQYIGDLLLTIVVSYFMVLAFESPVTVLEKVIFGTEKNKSIPEAVPGTIV